MTVRELPGWPPVWIGLSGRPAPRGEMGVLRAVERRVDLTGTRELRLTIESGEHQWTALYPGSADARAQFDALGGNVTLDRLYQIIGRYVLLLQGIKRDDLRGRNWGVYITMLQDAGADPKVIAVLHQIRSMYRNPVLHPEVFVTLDDAMGLLGVANSAVLAMVTDMKKRKGSAEP